MKYTDLGTQFLFQPIAVESLDPVHESARQFLVNLGHKITDRSSDDRKDNFLFQRLSVLLHRFNSVLLHDSLFLFTTRLMVVITFIILLQLAATNAVPVVVFFVYFQTIDWMVEEEKNLFAPHYAGYLGSNLDEAKKLQDKVVKFLPTCKVRPRHIFRHFIMMPS